MLAQLPVMPDLNLLTLLVVYGPMGVMLAWFMLRSERAMNTLAHRIDGMTRAMLFDTLSRDNVGPATRKLAQEMLTRIESRDEGKR